MRLPLGIVAAIAIMHSRLHSECLIRQRVRAWRMLELALVLLIASGLLCPTSSATPISQVRRIPDVMFGSRPTYRWRLRHSDLPLTSLGLYRGPTAGESYKSYIIGGISLMLFQTLLITRLVWERSRRRKAEAETAARGNGSLGRTHHTAATGPPTGPREGAPRGGVHVLNYEFDSEQS